jgi:hypothetical protein
MVDLGGYIIILMNHSGKMKLYGEWQISSFFLSLSLSLSLCMHQFVPMDCNGLDTRRGLDFSSSARA